MHSKNIFEIAVNHLLEIEGGYVNDSDDRGGETFYGISKAAHPDVDFQALNVEVAKAIYFKNYWKPYCLGLPGPLAVALFGGVVQHNANSAVRILQRALYVKPDSVIGPVTKKAARDADTELVLTLYLAGRAELYTKIIVSNSSQIKFARGWFKRLFLLQKFILTNTTILKGESK